MCSRDPCISKMEFCGPLDERMALFFIVVSIIGINHILCLPVNRAIRVVTQLIKGYQEGSSINSFEILS